MTLKIKEPGLCPKMVLHRLEIISRMQLVTVRPVISETICLIFNFRLNILSVITGVCPEQIVPLSTAINQIWQINEKLIYIYIKTKVERGLQQCTAVATDCHCCLFLSASSK